MKKVSTPAMFASLVFATTAWACDADVLSFPGADGGSTSSESTAASHSRAGTTSSASATEAQFAAAVESTPSVDASTTISNLTDAGATALCAWLRSEFTVAWGSDPLSYVDGGAIPTVPRAGYATGPSMSCSGTDGQVAWTGLPGPPCARNLRASPCEGTVGALTQCIRYFVEERDLATNPSLACNDVNAECSAFMQAPSCGETVLLPNDGQEGLCEGALPIEPGRGRCLCDGGACVPHAPSYDASSCIPSCASECAGDLYCIVECGC